MVPTVNRGGGWGALTFNPQQDGDQMVAWEVCRARG